MNRAIVRNAASMAAMKCPCGHSTRIFTAADNSPVSLHLTRIEDAQLHFHKKTTEIYYILEGEGEIDLDESAEPLQPGLSILIPPGVRHRIRGRARVLICAVPAFDDADEYFPDKEGNFLK